MTSDRARELEDRYGNELRLRIRAGGGDGVSVVEASWMLHAGWSKRNRARVWDTPDASTWIWSDLHLGHERSIKPFQRPFESAAECDAALWTAWNEVVEENDTIICLGDVSVDGEADATHHKEWAEARGTKWLILGNHDALPINRIWLFDIRTTTIAIYAAGDPPLVLTHVPLQRVPHGTVNVHGHLHHHPAPSQDQHVNVSIEQLDYRPVRLDDVRRLARAMQEGRSRPNERTRAALQRHR